MAWKAKLTDKRRDNGNVIATIVYTNSETGETVKTDIPSSTWTWASLRRHVGAWIRARESRDAGFDELVLGEIVPDFSATPPR